MGDGRRVAVKIQYPGVDQAIRDDLANTELLTTILRFATAAAGLKTDIRAVAREAAARITEELDYHHEAASIAAFSELYRDHPFIHIPDVVAETSTGRVLTMTYLDGMDWAAAQLADQDLKNAWGEAVFRFNWGNPRHANLLHADPHPGNYRFNTDGTIGVLDFGCVKVLPERRRRQLVEMTRAVLEGRTHDVRAALIDMEFLDNSSDLTDDELYEWQSQLYYEAAIMAQPATYTPQTTRRVISSIFDVRDASHPMARMHPPEDFVFFSRVQLAVTSICAGLQLTAPARAIHDDMDGVADPVTRLGKLHHAWARERRLPTALDRHDHI
jgi:predicted unusual protein kinase regulating ubiquinone biosynthesis (AarF/ABC1/UbiB family)